MVLVLVMIVQKWQLGQGLSCALSTVFFLSFSFCTHHAALISLLRNSRKLVCVCVCVRTLKGRG